MDGQPKTSGKAIAALICGIIGLVICGIILGIISIVLGKQAMAEIDSSGGAIGGRGLALAGVILGVVDIVGFAIFMILRFALMAS